jgi:RNA polymerase-binding protein DksA
MAISRKTKSPKPSSKGSPRKVKKKASTARAVKKERAGDKSPPSEGAASSAKASDARKKKGVAGPEKKKSTAKSRPPKPAKPRKPAVDPAFINTIREALVYQKRQLVEMMQTTQAQMAEKQTGLADMIDQATEGFEDELSLGLLKIEAAQIEDIIAAIERIDEGSYGLCEDCGKPIPRKRLEILPFALRCLNCKGTHERQARLKGNFDEED